MITIEKNVPIPRRGRPATYPFQEMEIGDSFLIPEQDEIARVSRAAYMYGNRNGKTFAVRRTEAGQRVWRLA
jgi:hypothetical protein